MWWDKFEPTDIFLSNMHVAVWRGDRHQCALVTPEEGWLQLLSKVLSTPDRRASCRVWLGGALCRLRLDPAIQGVNSIEEAEQALDAASRIAADKAEQSHRMLSWAPAADVWPSVGVDLGLIDSIELAVTGAGHRVKAVKPWWSGLAVAHPVDALLVDDGSATFWRWAGGRLTQAATVALTLDPQRRQASIRRLQAAGALACWRLDPARRGAAGSWLGTECCEDVHVAPA